VELEVVELDCMVKDHLEQLELTMIPQPQVVAKVDLEGLMHQMDILLELALIFTLRVEPVPNMVVVQVDRMQEHLLLHPLVVVVLFVLFGVHLRIIVCLQLVFHIMLLLGMNKDTI
jgi:hypothetical protein